MSENDRNQWKQVIIDLEQNVRTNRQAVEKKAFEEKRKAINVSRTPSESQASAESVDLLRRQVVAMELANQTAQEDKNEKVLLNTREAKTRKEQAIKKGQAKYDSILTEN